MVTTMSRYTPEQIARVRAESERLLRDEPRPAARAPASTREPPPRDHIAEWAEWHDARDAERRAAKAVMRRQAREEQQGNADAAVDFWRAVDARIAAALAEHERGILDIIREGLAGTGDLAEVVGRRLDLMEVTLDKLSAKLSELGSHEERRPTTLDLPNPLRRVN